MWIAKIKFSSKGTLVGSHAEKFGVSLFGFPLSYSYEGNGVFVQFVGTIFGSDTAKKNFFKNLKKEKRVRELELTEDFIVGIVKEPLYTKCIYNKDIIHVAPALISEKGYEIVTIGSFKRELLTRIIALFKSKYDGNLISITEKKLRSISVMKIRPELTSKQSKAMELAIKQGYYFSPRKIDVKTLAKLARVSFSTYQVHLRKAEEKLIPYFFE